MKLKTKIEHYGVTCAWEENYKLCFEFKRTYKAACKALKLKKLIELSNVVLGFPETQSYEIRRKKTHRTKKHCWVCGARAFVQHHIVLIKNGGFDNGINRIPICNGCHIEIHPWMKNKKTVNTV